MLDEAIAKIESKENNEKNKRIAEEIRKKYLKKYSDIFKEKLEKGDKVKCKNKSVWQSCMPYRRPTTMSREPLRLKFSLTTRTSRTISVWG